MIKYKIGKDRGEWKVIVNTMKVKVKWAQIRITQQKDKMKVCMKVCVWQRENQRGKREPGIKVDKNGIRNNGTNREK